MQDYLRFVKVTTLLTHTHISRWQIHTSIQVIPVHTNVIYCWWLWMCSFTARQNHVAKSHSINRANKVECKEKCPHFFHHTCKRTTWAGRAWQPLGRQGCADRALGPERPHHPATQPTAPGSSAAGGSAWSPAPAAEQRGLHTGTPMRPAPGKGGQNGWNVSVKGIRLSVGGKSLDRLENSG